MPQLPLPYRQVVPISVERHRTLSVEHVGYGFAASARWVPLTVAEISSAAVDYPVVFAGSPLIPIALLGVEANENLFVTDSGEWQGGYIPALIHNYPFVFQEDAVGTVTLCVDESWSGCNWEGRGQRLFTDSGDATPFLQDLAGRLDGYRSDVERTCEFCEKLQQFEILQAGRSEITLAGGHRRVFQGFIMASRERLEELSAASMEALTEAGALEPTYAHLASLDNLPDLCARSIERRKEVAARAAASHERSAGEPVSASTSVMAAKGSTPDCSQPKPGGPSADPAGGTSQPGAAQLLQLVDTLGVAYTRERSFRVCRNRLSTDRMLMGINRRDLPEPAARPMISRICNQLRMPQNHFESVQQSFNQIRAFHFGFESERIGCLYKVYLEYDVPREPSRDEACVPLHVAFKWDPADERRQVITHYHWYPALSVPDIEQRIRRLYRDEDREACEILTRLLWQACNGASSEGLQYLEVQEDNDRKSFDLNLYAVQVPMRDLQASWSRLFRHYQIPLDQSRSLLEQIHQRRLGHIAGGIHRNGQDFCTVYYGAEPLR